MAPPVSAPKISPRTDGDLLDESGLRLRNANEAMRAFSNFDSEASKEFHKRISNEPHKT